MSDTQRTVQHPISGDVRVIPVELAKQYEARGWKTTTAKAAAKDSTTGK